MTRSVITIKIDRIQHLSLKPDVAYTFYNCILYILFNRKKYFHHEKHKRHKKNKFYSTKYFVCFVYFVVKKNKTGPTSLQWSKS